MANDGDLNLGLNVEVSKAQAEIVKIKKDIEGLTGDVLQASRVISRHMENMTRDLKKALKTAAPEEYIAILRKIESAQDRAINSRSQGTDRTKVTNATVKLITNEARATADAVNARITDELVKVFSLKLRNINKAVDARLRMEIQKVEQLIENSSEDYLRAVSTRNRINRQRTVDVYSNPDLLAARDQRQRLNDDRMIQESKDTELLRARNIRQELANERAKERYLDRDRLDLERRAREQAEIVRRERVETFDQRRQERLRRQMEQTQRAQERAEAAKQRAADVELRAAEETLAQYTRRRRIERAKNINTFGQPEAPKSNEINLNSALERISSNGGSDIMAIQTRLMIGYQALSVFFNTVRSAGAFIVDLDKEFRQFQAVTATTNSEMVTLKQNLISVSEQSKFTALEIAQAATVMAQAGMSAREVSDSIGAVSLLATAAGTDLAQAVDVVTSTISIFNLQTTQTVDIANTLTAALNESKLTIDKITLGMQYAGNIAAQVGMSYQELMGVLGALANSGIRSGSTLGTGLRQLLVDIQNPTEKFQKTLKQLSLTQEDVNIETKGLVPVLKTLMDAGFTTAEAFESFEVRAAAAFAALSNNLDLAGKLQESFILSSAAVDANQVQMEALANTFQKFQSVAYTVVYNALEPMIAVLQDVLDVSANVLSVLNQYPAVLQVVGAGVSALLLGGVVKQIAALSRGLLIGLGLLKTVRDTTAAAATQMDLFERTTTRATRQLSLMNIVARANPYIMLATAVIGVVAAFVDFNSTATETANRIDQIKGELNTLEGDMDATTQEIVAADQAITNLYRQKAMLDKDPVARRAKIMEVTQAFKDLAGQVDASTSSVEDLINALNRLKAEDLKMNVARSETVQLTLEELESAYAQKLQQLETQRTQVFERLNREQGGDIVDENGVTRPGMQFNPEAEVARVAGIVGEKFIDALKLIYNPTQLPGSPSDLQAFKNQVSREQLTLGEEQRRLQQDARRGTLTSEGRERLAEIERILEQLSEIGDLLEPIVKTGLDIAATRSQLEVAREQSLTDRIEADPAFLELGERSKKINSVFSERISKLALNDLSGPDLLKALDQLEIEYNNTMAELKRQSDEVTAGIVERVGNGTNDETVKSRVVRTIDTNMATVRNDLVRRIADTADKVSKIYQRVYRENQKTNQAQIDTLLKRAKNTNSIAEVDAIEQSILKLLDERRKLIKAVFEAKIRAADSEDDKDNLRDQLNEQMDQLAETEQQYVEGFNERVKAIRSDYLRMMEGGVEDQIDALKREIAATTEKLKQLRPGAAFDAVRRNINEMINELGRLQNDKSTIAIQRQALADGGAQGGNFNNMLDLIGSAEGTDKGRGYNETLGYGAFTGGDVNLTSMTLNEVLTLQRRMLAHPANHYNSSAVGRYQIVSKTLRGLMEEMGLTGNELFDENMQDQMAVSLLRRRGNDPENLRNEWEGLRRVDDDTIRNAYAGSLNAGDLASQQQTVRDAQRDVADATIKSTIDSVKKTADSIVKNSTQQIETTIAQSKISNDPEAIQRLTGAVNEQYEKIIDEKTKAFKAENAQLAMSDYGEFKSQLEEMQSGLRADQNQKLTALMEQYWRAVEEKTEQPIKDAQLALQEAQRPENASKYTQGEIASLEGNVRLAERKALIDQIAASEQMLLRVREQLTAAESQFGAGSSEATYWMQEEANIKQRLVELTSQKTAADAAQSRQNTSLSATIQDVNQQWMIQNGLMQRTSSGALQMVPIAQQVGQAWSQILDGLTSGFSQLFMDLASGTMSAKDAFKKFAMSTIQMFMQLIAKALAYQLIMKMIGGTSGSSGGGFFSMLLTGLTGTPMANGGVIRAANGTIAPYRDNVLINAMPGEGILRKSAMDVIGQDGFTELNNLGNRKISKPEKQPEDRQGGGGVVNVWVVSEDQVPPPGPNDIIATVADNINRRGTIKQLIQQVQMGAI